MYRKFAAPSLAVFCFLLVVTSLYLGRERLTWKSNYVPITHEKEQTDESLTSLTSSVIATATRAEVEQSSSSSALPSPTSASLQTPLITNGTILSAERISPYISAILNSSSTALPRLECPVLNTNRYKSLQLPQKDQEIQDHQIDYFFALNLRNCIDVLPRLVGSIVEAVRFLGPQRCALSIVEGNSPDGTSDILSSLQPFLEDLGLGYFYNSSSINPAKGNARIRKLAQLRNLALTPLYKEQVRVTEDTTVLFVNDVSACAEDLLELALQRRSLNADMTCAMDWTYVGPDPTFYDIWIARTIAGDSFFEVGSDGNWNSAWNLFWNAPETQYRYRAQQPFQVFACWNGATAFTAAPLLHGLRFRDVHGDKGECFQGEPQLFCKDMWHRGYRKIAVVPSVNLEYSDEKAADIKKLKGYVSDIVEDQEDNAVDWVFEPPEQVRCMPTWEKQSWRPWNETLE
ncbi:cryptococcal mannosyltransferase 1-domain-containing protein [Fusarium tricinctum]|uniref:Cryptococcal mannosyltransferase 1-domain-containing protein n=1 Tax=Fusarium tricinctum TaxID=61284 RepID=A0A8K0RNP2_9HYPO|nr:cryptococcal mannosyltransferase 1-domain-containing protein [Fusarium tricinctum]